MSMSMSPVHVKPRPLPAGPMVCTATMCAYDKRPVQVRDAKYWKHLEYGCVLVHPDLLKRSDRK